MIPAIDINFFKRTSDVDIFISNLRYAQHKSMVTGNFWRVKIFKTEKKYLIDNDNDDSSLPQLPYGNNPVYVNDGIRCNNCEFYFDFYGRPLDKFHRLIKKRIRIIVDYKIIIIEPYSGGIYVKE